jgi:hypothetical protein
MSIKYRRTYTSLCHTVKNRASILGSDWLILYISYDAAASLMRMPFLTIFSAYQRINFLLVGTWLLFYEKKSNWSDRETIYEGNWRLRIFIPIKKWWWNQPSSTYSGSSFLEGMIRDLITCQGLTSHDWNRSMVLREKEDRVTIKRMKAAM